MDVYVSSMEQAASYGGALLARYAWWKQSHPNGSTGDMMNRERRGVDLECVAKPRTHATRVYDSLVSIYDYCENQIVKNLGT